MKKIIQACGFHCIKINNLGVKFADQVVLEDINLHIHCGSLNAIIGKNGAYRNVMAFQPPLIITKDNVNDVLNALDLVLTEKKL